MTELNKPRLIVVGFVLLITGFIIGLISAGIVYLNRLKI